jgi:hypothetical protein
MSIKLNFVKNIIRINIKILVICFYYIKYKLNMAYNFNRIIMLYRLFLKVLTEKSKSQFPVFRINSIFYMLNNVSNMNKNLVSLIGNGGT